MDEAKAKELLSNDIEEFKKYLKDCSTLVQSAIQFRTATMALHEAGNKFTADVKKLGERYTGNKWAARFLQIADEHEAIEKARYEWQTNLWDHFILPMMSAADPDQKDLVATEKKLKAVLSQIKKEQKKKKKSADDHTGDDLPKPDDVVKYFWTWENQRFHKHLSYLDAAVDKEKEFFRLGYDHLRKDVWKQAVNNPPEALPENFGEKGSTSTSSTLSPSTPRRGTTLVPEKLSETPTSPSTSTNRSSIILGSSESLPVNNKTYVKCGYLEKTGSSLMKSKKKYWFMLSNENVLEYYTSFNQGKETAQGSINLSECQELSLDPKKKQQFSFKGKDGKEFTFTAPNEKDFEAWYKLINLVVPEVPATDAHRKSTNGILKRAGSIILGEGESMLKAAEKEKEKEKESNQTVETKELKEETPKQEETIPELPPKIELPPAAADWVQYQTDDGQDYWYNSTTGESVWEKPY